MTGPGSWIREQGSDDSVEKQALFRRLISIAVILAAVLVAIAPQLYLGNSCGHDFDFHLVSWLDAQQSWRQGILYPHWSPSSNYGAGEPRFIFYPPLSWMLGAALGFVLPWKFVSVAMTYLFLAGTGLATRALARQKLSEGPASLAGCAALFSGYALFTAYERSDFGELAGGFWIPLLLLFILRDRLPNAPGWRRAFDGSTASLALALAGAWLSNAPLGVMAGYLLAAVALAAAVLRRSAAPLVRATVAATLGLGLAALYILPAAYEQRWVEIGQAVDDPGYQVENSWFFAHHADPALELHDLELLKASAIGATMLAVALCGILVAWARRRWRDQTRWWIPLALIPFAVLFLQFPLSAPLWKVVPELRFLQFPWRWLVVVEAPMALFFASAVWVARGRWRIAVLAVCGAVFLTATGAAAFSFFQVCDEEDAVSGMLNVYRTGTGFEGSDEYAPRHADNSLLPIGLPAACLAPSPTLLLGATSTAGSDADETNPQWNANQGSCTQTFPDSPDSSRPPAEHRRIDANAQRPGFLILHLRGYPAWQIKVNGSLAQNFPERADGLIAVPIAQGRNYVTVDWTATRDVWLGRGVSVVALLLLTWVCVVERRRAQPRLS
jgi:hypothetical protein